MGPLRWFALVCLVAAGACGNPDASPSSWDAGVTHADTGLPICGKLGDRGNSNGVGKYCNALGACPTNVQASICAILGDASQHYCTMFCQSPDAGVANPCGAGASCRCDRMQGLCSCVPEACQ